MARHSSGPIETQVSGVPRRLRFGPGPLVEAMGKLLGHNVTGADGRPLLRKGRALTPGDVAALVALGRATVYVAEPGPRDVGENVAARRMAKRRWARACVSWARTPAAPTCWPRSGPVPRGPGATPRP